MAWDEFDNSDDSDFDDDGFDNEPDDQGDDTIACPSCGRAIYDDAPQCPYCGAYVTTDTGVWSDKPAWIVVIYKTIAVLLIVSLLGSGLFWLLQFVLSLLSP